MDEKDDFDTLLEPLGGFGRFQKLNLFCLTLIAIFCPLCELSYVMTAAELKHRCFIPEFDKPDTSYDQPWLSDVIPSTSAGGFESCLRYNCSTPICDVKTRDVVQCDTFIYETDEWTIEREDWDIHCDDDKWKLSLLGSLNNAGQFAGGFFVGYLSDRFGRKRTLVSLSLAAAMFGVIKSFSINFTMMVTFEILQEVMTAGLTLGPFVLALEIVEPSKRVLAAAIISMAYPVGEIILSAVQWLTLEWRTTLRILYAPYLLQIVLFWIVPESVRWLITNKKNDEALSVLRRIAKMNGRDFPESTENVLKCMEQTHQEEDGTDKWAAYSAMFKSQRLRIRLLTCYLIWMANLFVYVGMALVAVSMNENKFLNFILMASVEILSCILAMFLVDKIGRRYYLSGSFLLCGVACLVYVFSDDSWGWSRVAIYLIGRFGSASSYVTLSIYTTELFPTSIRSSVTSWMLTGGKLASILAPQAPLLADIFKPLPMLVFSVTAIIAASLTLIFPETLNTKLPDTVEEAEGLGRKSNSQTHF